MDILAITYKIGNKNNPVSGCFSNQHILTYVTKILSIHQNVVSKLSKRCCFIPYKSFENVLRMKLNGGWFGMVAGLFVKVFAKRLGCEPCKINGLPTSICGNFRSTGDIK